MYTASLRNNLLNVYATNKELMARKFKDFLSSSNVPWIIEGFLRFQYPHDYKKPKMRTNFPGPQHYEALAQADAANSIDASQRAQVSITNYTADLSWKLLILTWPTLFRLWASSI